MNFVEKMCSREGSDRMHRFLGVHSRDWCNIIPLTKDGKLVMVRQFRVGTEDFSLEFPGGLIDADDPSNASGALRELEEETGFKPTADAKVHYLGWVYPNPAILNNRAHSFVVGPVEKSSVQHLDTDEMVEVVEVPFTDLPRLIAEDKFKHALMLNSLLFLLLPDLNLSELLQQQVNKCVTS